MSRWLMCAFVSVFFWGAWALVFAAASGMMSPLMALVLSTAGLLPVIAAQLFSSHVWTGTRIGHGMAWGVLTGLAGALGNAAYSESIVRGGEASIVTPLTAMFPLVTAILAVAFLRERIN